MQTKAKDLFDHVYICQRDERYVSAIALMSAVLNEDYNMGTNRKNTGRLDELIEYCTLEYTKIQLDPMKYNVDWYINKAKEKTGVEITK